MNFAGCNWDNQELKKINARCLHEQSFIKFFKLNYLYLKVTINTMFDQNKPSIYFQKTITRIKITTIAIQHDVLNIGSLFSSISND